MKSSNLLEHSLQISTPNSHLCAEFYIRELELAISKVKSNAQIESAALSPLVNNFAQVLDKVVMTFLHQDITEYKMAKNIKTSNISQKNASEEFKKYRQSYNTGGLFGFFKQDNFYAGILKKYPAMQKIINDMCENFVENSNRLFMRIEQDQEMLKEQFLQGMKNPKLSRIIPTGSDFHKQGQQVHILEFVDDDGEKRKIVYKPSPVMSDAIIVGDMKRLSQIDERYHGHQSMIEIINNTAKDESHLPTYLVIPKVDGDKGDINSHYGYIEFIEHEPAFHFDAEKIAEENISRSDISIIAQDQYKSHVQSTLSSKTKSDFVLNTEELNNYSYLCGRLLAMMQLVGLTDLHCENLIIHNGKPYLIDAEASFSLQSLPSAEQTACFRPDNGALNGDSMQEKYFYFIRDIRGMQNVYCISPALNKVVLFDENTNIAVLNSSPNQAELLNGYKSVMDEFARNPQPILGWFDQPMTSEMKVRFIPKSTSEYAETMQYLFRENFSEEKYNQNNKKKLLDEAEKYLTNVAKYDEAQRAKKCEDNDLKTHIEFNIGQPPLPVYCADMSTSIFSEYLTSNIPFFYMNVSQQQLFDSRNYPLQIPAGIPRIYSSLNSHDDVGHHLDDKDYVDTLITPSNDDQFFPQPPIIMARQRAEIISENQELRDLMQSEVQGLMGAYYSSQDVQAIEIHPTHQLTPLHS